MTTLLTRAQSFIAVSEHRDRDALEKLAVWHLAAPLATVPLLLATGAIEAPLPRVVISSVLASAFVLGVALMCWLRTPRSAIEVARTDGAVFAADIVLLVAAASIATKSPFAALMIPVLVATRSRQGVILTTGIALTVSEAVRHAILRASSDIIPNRDVSIQLVVLGVAIALVIRQLITQLEERSRQAEDEAARATRQERRTEALNRITLAGVGGTSAEAIGAALHEACRQLPDVGWAFVAAGPDGDAEPIIAGAGDLSAVPGLPTSIDAVLAGAAATASCPGAERDACFVVAPVRGRSELIGALVALRDVDPQDHGVRFVQAVADQIGVLAEAARAYERETELVERYKALDRLRTDFVSLTSHELRTPTTVIRGFAETLQGRGIDDPAQVAPLADAIVRHARRLERVVDDLRTISTLDAGRLRIERRPFTVGEVIGTALEGLGADGLTVEGPAGLQVVSDPERLTQIVAALVGNAVEHGAAPINLRWRATETELVVDIEDHGPGIPEELHEEVFDRFRTGHDIMSHGKGTGLGLPIARDLTQLLGGELALLRGGAGASFRVVLPRSPSHADVGEQPVDEQLGVERREVVDVLAQADQLHG